MVMKYGLVLYGYCTICYLVVFSLSKREILTSVSRSEEEMVEEVGEPVIKVLKEADPEKSRLLISPSLALSGLSPKGHPSSCTQI